MAYYYMKWILLTVRKKHDLSVRPAGTKTLQKDLKEWKGSHLALVRMSGEVSRFGPYGR